MKKVCIVTGGNAGIGKEIGDAFDSAGYAVFRPSRRNGFDLAQADTPPRILREALTNPVYGRIDVLVNNARAERTAPDTDQWRVDLIAPWELSHLACGQMEIGGSIINIGSTTGRCVSRESAPYQISKAALEHMTRVLAMQCGPGVTANCLVLGWIEKEYTVYPDKAKYIHAVKRLGKPQDVAQACLFLAGQHWITGASIVMDGGMTLRDLSSTV